MCTMSNWDNWLEPRTGNTELLLKPQFCFRLLCYCLNCKTQLQGSFVHFTIQFFGVITYCTLSSFHNHVSWKKATALRFVTLHRKTRLINKSVFWGVWGHLETLWKLGFGGFETLWKPVGNPLETLWKPFKNPLETRWKPFGNRLETL